MLFRRQRGGAARRVLAIWFSCFVAFVAGGLATATTLLMVPEPVQAAPKQRHRRRAARRHRTSRPAAVQAPAVLVSRPINVIFRDPLGNKNDAAYRVARRLRLEAGVMVPATAGLNAREAAGDRAKYLLRATEAVEGGFDAVNVYDKGILSWGIMQWASHSNSLQNALWYMKNRLATKNRRYLWAQLFKANGLDVQRGPDGSAAFFVGSNATGQWRPVVGVENLRVLFRGTRNEGRYDPATISRWARVFSRAGQQPAIQQLQTEWATIRLETCLNESVDGQWRVRHYTNGDLFSDALYFALWTNNPNACRAHFRQAIRQARIVSGAMDPKNWPPGLFPLLWEQMAATSGFGTWPQRTASVARLVPVGQIGRNRARFELTSRGWRLDQLRRGIAVGRTWRRELPPPVPWALRNARVAAAATLVRPPAPPPQSPVTGAGVAAGAAPRPKPLAAPPPLTPPNASSSSGGGATPLTGG